MKFEPKLPCRMRTVSDGQGPTLANMSEVPMTRGVCVTELPST